MRVVLVNMYVIVQQIPKTFVPVFFSPCNILSVKIRKELGLTE